jgi:hypothetical protein
MFKITVDETGRVTGFYPEYAQVGILVDDVPSSTEHAVELSDYLYRNGEFIYSPLPDETQATPAEGERSDT